MLFTNNNNLHCKQTQQTVVITNSNNSVKNMPITTTAVLCMVFIDDFNNGVFIVFIAITPRARERKGRPLNEMPGGHRRAVRQADNISIVFDTTDVYWGYTHTHTRRIGFVFQWTTFSQQSLRTGGDLQYTPSASKYFFSVSS